MNLPEDMKSMISIGVIVVVSVAGLQIMLNEPLRTEAEIIGLQAHAARDELNGQTSLGGVTGANLDQRHARAQRIVSRATRLGAVALDALTIHETQSELGRKHNLDIRRMEPIRQGQANGNGASRWRGYRIEAQGSYESIARFIIDLENQDELCRLDKLRLTSENTGPRDHVIVSIIVSYYTRPDTSLLNASRYTAEVRE